MIDFVFLKGSFSVRSVSYRAMKKRVQQFDNVGGCVKRSLALRALFFVARPRATWPVKISQVQLVENIMFCVQSRCGCFLDFRFVGLVMRRASECCDEKDTE